MMLIRQCNRGAATAPLSRPARRKSDTHTIHHFARISVFPKLCFARKNIKRRETKKISIIFVLLYTLFARILYTPQIKVI